MDSHHAMDYIELPARDLAVSRQFYADAFGWRFNDYGPGYAGILDADGDGEVGGINAMSPQGTSPLVLLRSDDLDASAAAVVAAEGTIVTGPDAYPGGRRFEFTDPAGVRLGVHQPEA